MKTIILSLSLILSFSIMVFSQKPKSIFTVDLAKSKANFLDSAVVSLQKNWSEARVYAKKHKYIKSYQLMIAKSELNEDHDYDIILITEYADKAMFDKAEENFKKIFDKYLPNMILVNGKKTRDYLDFKHFLTFEESVPFFQK